MREFTKVEEIFSKKCEIIHIPTIQEPTQTKQKKTKDTIKTKENWPLIAMLMALCKNSNLYIPIEVTCDNFGRNMCIIIVLVFFCYRHAKHRTP